jgi:hypothetical protein
MEMPPSSKQLCISIAQDVAECRCGRSEKGGESSLSSSADTTESRPLVDVQEVFRLDKRHNRDSISKAATGCRYGGLLVDGSLREKHEVCIWMKTRIR